MRYGAVTDHDGNSWTGPDNEMIVYREGGEEEATPRLRLELADPSKVSLVATGVMFKS